nr:MAG TPA: hypothetical protein [Inoviridae sp.]
MGASALCPLETREEQQRSPRHPAGGRIDQSRAAGPLRLRDLGALKKTRKIWKKGLTKVYT